MTQSTDASITEAHAPRTDVDPGRYGAAVACAPSRDGSRAGPWWQWLRPSGFEWNRIELPVPGLAPVLDGLRLLHLSDFHLRKNKWYPEFDELLTRVRDDPPDLLLSTGDYVDDKKNYHPALPLVRRLVEGFRARLGCFGVVGNHDGSRLADELRGTNLTMIVGERRYLEDRGAGIEVIGLPGVKRKDFRRDFVGTVPPRRDGVLRIVLSHYPDHLKRTEPLRPDLFLAGHTHGGQVCLPNGLPILRHDSLPRRLCSGAHRVGDAWLVVNRGLGFSGFPPIRLFCPAEVVEIVLRSAEVEGGE